MVNIIGESLRLKTKKSFLFWMQLSIYPYESTGLFSKSISITVVISISGFKSII
jgi:hypothetical protein